jgi:sec-independent protein translocase protein TatA
MSNIGFWEIVVILLIILILFGAAKLPEIGRALGKAIYEFKKAGKGLEEENKDSEKKQKL